MLVCFELEWIVCNSDPSSFKDFTDREDISEVYFRYPFICRYSRSNIYSHLEPLNSINDVICYPSFLNISIYLISQSVVQVPPQKVQSKTQRSGEEGIVSRQKSDYHQAEVTRKKASVTESKERKKLISATTITASSSAEANPTQPDTVKPPEFTEEDARLLYDFIYSLPFRRMLAANIQFFYQTHPEVKDRMKGKIKDICAAFPMLLDIERVGKAGMMSDSCVY